MQAQKPMVLVGVELADLNQAVEGFVDELLAGADVVEDFLAEDEVPRVLPVVGFRRGADVAHRTVLIGTDVVKGHVGAHADEIGDLAVGDGPLHVGPQVDVQEAVGVVGQKDLLALEVRPHRQQALGDVGLQAGVGEGDPPVVDVAGDEFDLLASGHHEIVGEGFLVVEEVLLDEVGAVPQAEDEVLVAEVGVELHDVPEDGPVADGHHGLGNAL